MDADESKEKVQSTSGLNISEIIDIGTKSSALLFGAIYICGFIILNSHYFKYGVIDLGLVNADYIAAGSVFLIYLIVYGLFGGRAVVFGKDWLEQRVKYVLELKSPLITPFLLIVNAFVNGVFFHCLSAALFAGLAFGHHETVGFYSALGGVFILTYGMDVANIELKYPLFHVIVDTLVKLFAIYSFFALSENDKLFSLFFIFIGYTFYINLVLDRFERWEITKDLLVFTVVFSLIFLIISAATFGTAVYGDVSKKVGGGEGMEMEVALDVNMLDGLANEYGDSVVGSVIFSNSNYLYLNIDSETLVLPKSSIKWLRYSRPEENDFADSVWRYFNLGAPSEEDKIDELQDSKESKKR
ncbi:MAG: hypothetical protein AB2687_01890 [Candidatus Thiodiazotropha taylori]